MDTKGYRVTDAHCHIFPDKIADKATESTDRFYGIKHHSAYNGSVSGLLSQCEKTGVSRCVVNSVATSPKQVSGINHFIAQETALHPKEFVGLGTMHPDSSDLKADFREIQELGLRGVKLHPDIQGFKIDDYRCLKIYELCEEAGLPILLHTGDSRFDLSNPNRVFPVMEIYTRLTVIGAHLGGWSLWEEASERLSGLPNFYVDTSSSFYALPKDTALTIIRRYGADKVVFGSDYPMWRQKDELDYLFSLGLSDEELEQILHGTIERVLKL